MNKRGLGLSIGLASIAITGSVVQPQLVKAEDEVLDLAVNTEIENLREEKTHTINNNEETLLAEKALKSELHTEEIKLAEAMEIKEEYAAIHTPAENDSTEVAKVEATEEVVEETVEEVVEETLIAENLVVEETIAQVGDQVQLSGQEVVEEVASEEAIEEVVEEVASEDTVEEVVEEVASSEVVEEVEQVQLASSEEKEVEIPKVTSEEREISIPFNGWLSANMNVRQQKSTSSTILGVLPLGTKIEGRIKDGWLEFEYNNQKAYLVSDYLSKEEVVVRQEEEADDVVTESGNTETETQENTAPAQPKVEATKQGYVTSPVNVRDAGSMNSNILGVLPRGTEVIGVRQGHWIQIDYNGRKAYISVNLVGEQAPQKQEQKAPVQDAGQANGRTAAIVQEAHRLLGYPYVWGAHNPSTGFDCSGLVYYLYQKHAGVSLNRSSYQMVNNGYQVSRNALKPGDLLLFNSGGNSRISHVGLYIGNGEMIHSSTPSTGVIKSSIASGYFANTFVTARRIID